MLAWVLFWIAVGIFVWIFIGGVFIVTLAWRKWGLSFDEHNHPIVNGFLAFLWLIWPVVLLYWLAGWLASAYMDVCEMVGLYQFDGYRLNEKREPWLK